MASSLVAYNRREKAFPSLALSLTLGQSSDLLGTTATYLPKEMCPEEGVPLTAEEVVDKRKAEKQKVC